MKKIIAILLLFAFGFSSCEKDDICDPNTPTTPRLIISFFDINNPTLKKKVTNLKVIGKGQEEGIVFNETATDEDKYLTNGDSIAIPIRTDTIATTYKFILNSGNTNPAQVNTDVVTFTYAAKNVYVSRACGFKTVFQMDSQKPYEQQTPDPDGFWMQSIDQIIYNIELENETHVKVYF